LPGSNFGYNNSFNSSFPFQTEMQDWEKHRAMYRVSSSTTNTAATETERMSEPRHETPQGYKKTKTSQDRAAVGLPLGVLPWRRHLCRRPHGQLSSNHQCREATVGRGAAHGPSDAKPKEVQRSRLGTEQW